MAAPKGVGIEEKQPPQGPAFQMCRKGNGAEPRWEPRKWGLGGLEETAPHPGAWREHNVESGAEGEGPTTGCLGANTPDHFRGPKGFYLSRVSSPDRGDSINVIECPATYTKKGACTVL